MKITGVTAAIIELTLYLYISHSIRNSYNYNYTEIDALSYYWIAFTILTGIWETTYLLRRNSVIKTSQELIKNNQHVWTNRYPLNIVIPKNFSKIFYSEYGAWADREYMTNTNKWSAFVEGSHCLFCAGLSLISLVYYFNGNSLNFYIALSTAMGNQFMNSVLYLAEYTIQVRDSNSLNYNNDKFPTGFMLLKRPFMWINILWIVMPVYIVLKLLHTNYNLSIAIGLLSKIL